jgi:large subunit ribosomal protein L31e
MAKKRDSAAEPPERIYTIPLRGEWLRGPRIGRAGATAAATRRFLSRHMKVGRVKISGKLNERLWAGGLKKPPASIKVKAHMDEEGVVTAMLPDETIAKEEEKSKMDKLKEKLGSGKGAEAKPEEGKPAEAKEEPKPGEKLAEAPTEEKKKAPPEEKKEEARPEEKPPEGGKPAEARKGPKPIEEKG